MTFNGTNVDAYVLPKRIKVKRTPVFSNAVTTLTGEEKKVLVRYRTELTVPIMPMTAATLQTLLATLSPNPVTVGFTSPYDTTASRSMYCENLEEELAVPKQSGDYFSGSELIFVEV